MSRGSEFLRHIGRLVRRCDLGILRAAESFLVRHCPDDVDMPFLAVCGAPRSGHTLTQQVITQGLQVFVVDNLQAVFYRTPLIGYLLSKIVSRPYISDYESIGGHIPGLNGPHDGGWMWQYWCDMDEDEHRPQPDPAHLREFRKLLHKLYALDGRPFCDSWLGLALYFEQLQDIFRSNIIICTRRDLLSTALSIMKYAQNRHGAYRLNWSTQPRECLDPSVTSRLSSYERIARQVYFINRRMDEQAVTGRYAVFNSTYSNLCDDPRDFISRLIAFAQAKNILLEPRTDVVLPARFTATKTYRDQNEHAKQFALVFDALLEQYGPVSVPIESS